MNSVKVTGGAHASAFSLAILSGAAGLTIAEYIPDVLSGGAGFIVGFVSGFIIFSVIVYSVYTRPRLDTETDKLRELITQVKAEMQNVRRG